MHGSNRGCAACHAGAEMGEVLAALPGWTMACAAPGFTLFRRLLIGMRLQQVKDQHALHCIWSALLWESAAASL